MTSRQIITVHTLRTRWALLLEMGLNRSIFRTRGNHGAARHSATLGQLIKREQLLHFHSTEPPRRCGIRSSGRNTRMKTKTVFQTSTTREHLMGVFERQSSSPSQLESTSDPNLAWFMRTTRRAPGTTRLWRSSSRNGRTEMRST